MQLSTEQLVAQARAGDRGSLDELFCRAARLARARALKVLGDEDAADDVAQEALVAAYAGLPGLRNAGGFLAWLRRIVDRAAARHLEGAAGVRTAPIGEDLPSPDPTPDDVVQQDEGRRVVLRALAALPPRSRLAVELFYFDGLTCAEVAGFLDASVDSVKQVLSRARQRLRRGVTAMVAAPKKAYRTWLMMVTGDATFAGPLFEHDSEVSRLYMALYPLGDADAAAREAGIEPAKAPDLVSFLEARGLVAREGTRLRCTMPIVDDLDLEILRPWVERTAAAVTDELDGLAAQAREIASGLATESARSTAMAVALIADPVTRPLVGIADAMETGVPDRGDFGQFTAAVSVAGDTPQGFGCGFGSEWVDTPHGQCYAIFMRPRGTDRSAVDAFLARHPALARADSPAQLLSAFLCSLDASSLTRKDVAKRVAEAGIADDPDPFVADLVAAGGAWWDGDTLRCGAAVDTVSRWAPYWDRFDPIGEEVVERLGEGAADLRKRVARCSFPGCNFADAVTACVMLVRGAIAAEVRRRGLVTVPTVADLSWGYLLVRA